MNLEHPDITHTMATGYPNSPEEPEYFCERCGREIYKGEDYYEVGDEILCEKCVERMRRIA